MEVHQVAQTQAAHAEIGQDLRLMRREDGGDLTGSPLAAQPRRSGAASLRFPLGAGLPIQYHRIMHQPRATGPANQPRSTTNHAPKPLRRESTARAARRTRPPTVAPTGHAASVALWWILMRSIVPIGASRVPPQQTPLAP